MVTRELVNVIHKKNAAPNKRCFENMAESIEVCIDDIFEIRDIKRMGWAAMIQEKKCITHTPKKSRWSNQSMQIHRWDECSPLHGSVATTVTHKWPGTPWIWPEKGFGSRLGKARALHSLQHGEDGGVGKGSEEIGEGRVHFWPRGSPGDWGLGGARRGGWGEPMGLPPTQTHAGCDKGRPNYP